MENILTKINFDINRDTFIYTNRFGQPVPRVTEILSTMIHSDSLMYWANSLGFKRIRYKDELEKAANIGTAAHESIETFFKDNIETDTNVSFLAFKKWFDIVSKNNKVEVLFVEEPLVSDYYGGTCDLVLKINGKIYLIDFKTSNHITFKYYLQLAAYKYMLLLKHGINIDGTVILQLSKTCPEFNEFVLDFSNPVHNEFMNHCMNTFHSLVVGYYHIKKAEMAYKEIFK